MEPGVAKTEYEMNGQGGLDQLLAALDGGVQGLGQAEPEAGLTKIVLARRSDIKFTGKLDPLVLLEALQVSSLLLVTSHLLRVLLVPIALTMSGTMLVHECTLLYLIVCCSQSKEAVLQVDKLSRILCSPVCIHVRYMLLSFKPTVCCMHCLITG